MSTNSPLSTWRLLSCACLFAALIASGCAKLYNQTLVSAGAEYWIPELDGHVRLDDGPLSGTSIDFDDELDLDDEETANYVARLQIGSWVIEGSYFDLDYSGNNTVTRDVTFGGETFTVGTDVRSDLEIQYASVKGKLGLVGFGPLAVGVILGVNYADLDGSLDSSLGRASENLEAPFPVVGGIVTVNQDLADWVSVFVETEVSGIAIDAYDIKGHFVDAFGRAGFQFPFVKVGAGYRHIELDFEDTDSDDFTWDFSLGGPMVFAEVVF